MLATAATTLLHGAGAASEAAEASRRAFEQGESADGLPTIEVAAADLDGGIGVLALAVQAGLARSNGEARRHIRGGGLRLNGEPVGDEGASITGADLVETLRGARGHDWLPERVVVAVNQSYAEAATPLSNGDEVALIPPVAGG